MFMLLVFDSSKLCVLSSCSGIRGSKGAYCHDEEMSQIDIYSLWNKLPQCLSSQ